MPIINFEAKLTKVESETILTLPASASLKLPSRGMVMVKGTINTTPFQAGLEPDGKKGHWLKVDNELRKAIGATEGDTVRLEIEPTKDWPEPIVPADIQAALTADALANNLWTKITPMARWDWIRWINSTANPATRQRRIEVACSKLTAGSRRPCCFNRSECTDPSVSKRGVLLDIA
ncbi:MAG: hypothetical protein JWN38_18 [Candidatus Saccharibacteria bacterium]|nr:hypothetical protein [Candidatus Saccharibacteria bacterium]